LISLHLTDISSPDKPPPLWFESQTLIMLFDGSKDEEKDDSHVVYSNEVVASLRGVPIMFLNTDGDSVHNSRVTGTTVSRSKQPNGIDQSVESFEQYNGQNLNLNYQHRQELIDEEIMRGKERTEIYCDQESLDSDLSCISFAARHVNGFDDPENMPVINEEVLENHFAAYQDECETNSTIDPNNMPPCFLGSSSAASVQSLITLISHHLQNNILHWDTPDGNTHSKEILTNLQSDTAEDSGPKEEIISQPIINTSPRVRSRKLRILALHGKKGNNKVTKLQLKNLQITEDQYDIVYFNGLIEEKDGNPDHPEVVDGPFYSWFHDDYTDPGFRTSIFQAASDVLMAIKTMGPFDAIYGFSQGASVATIVASAYSNEEIRKILMQGSFTSVNQTEDEQIMDIPSIDYMILACACDLSARARKALQISADSIAKLSIDIPSLHLVATDDSCRSESEDISGLFSNSHIQYITGAHCVRRSIVDDEILLTSVTENLQALQNSIPISLPEMKKMSEISSISVMQDRQAVFVDLDGLMDDATISRALELWEPESPLFYNAREIDTSKVTTYGDVLEFIRGGPGDLRHLNIKEAEVVAYCAPPGAASALAFLSIAAQTAAAPLAPTISESDCLYFLEMCGANHLIIFDNVQCPGVESASAALKNNGKIKIHRAYLRDEDKPGWFEYETSQMQTLNTEAPAGVALQNSSDSIALLLATSGTTSKPKGVPLKHGSIVQNGQIIASSLGLRKSDICYNIMPLFHIGGISSSILSTLLSGGAVCCDNEPFDAENMVDAIALSEPQPTWYSAVPTIHNLTVLYIKENVDSMKSQMYGIKSNAVWNEGHSLRFIRSGAAALLGPDAEALSTTYGDIPVYPTYSMSEQMPISQPPYGKDDMLKDKVGSVGIPIAASLAIVDSATFRVLPYGQVGEVAISGPTVIKRYLNNPEADKKAFFELTLPFKGTSKFARNRFFLTGDTGIIDEAGFLTLKGRNKELIKKGGEQVSPFEVEEALITHAWVELAICFAVSSKLYGEEVGCALVLSSSAPTDTTTQDVLIKMREELWINDLCPSKWPSKWVIVEDEDLPKTKSKKYIRIGLAQKLGVTEDDHVLKNISNSNNNMAYCPLEEQATELSRSNTQNNAHIDWDVISGFRFVLACYVMFMHVGSNRSWGNFDNLRGFPWHVHCFFTLGGFSMAAPMNPEIEKKLKYFLARIGNMYPMYVVAVIFTLANLLVTCRPSTFRPDFHWTSQPDDLFKDGNEENGFSSFFCEGTPLTPNSYWASLILTIIIYLLGLTITPLWFAHWWMGFYFWFASMYYQCLMIFPALYNKLLKWRGNASKFLLLISCLLGMNYVFLLGAWFGIKGARGYEHYDPLTLEGNPSVAYNTDAFIPNTIVLGWYLFSPFWMLYFIVGSCSAFLYDAKRPADQRNAMIWGVVADLCTILIFAWSTCIVMQGTAIAKGDTWNLRPDEANHQLLDAATTRRIWDSIHGRLVAPLTTLWIFALSTGQGWTASIFRVRILSKWMAPHAYNTFLFHQTIGQWYYAATRNGQWWNWWQYRKELYWFSPQPLPVEWYEYFGIVILTVLFSFLMQKTLEPIASSTMISCKRYLFSSLFEEFDETDLNLSVHSAIEDLTGLSPESEWTLGQSGLSSVGLPQLATRLGNSIRDSALPVAISAKDLAKAQTVGDIVRVLEESMHNKEYDLTGESKRKNVLSDMLSRSFHRSKYDLEGDGAPRSNFGNILGRSQRKRHDLESGTSQRRTLGDGLSRSFHGKKYRLDECSNMDTSKKQVKKYDLEENVDEKNGHDDANNHLTSYQAQTYVSDQSTTCYADTEHEMKISSELFSTYPKKTTSGSDSSRGHGNIADGLDVIETNYKCNESNKGKSNPKKEAPLEEHLSKTY